MVTPRGRAASPVRPGFIVKKTLQGEIPLRDTGELVHEAAIVDLFNSYKGELERINSLRLKANQIRGMRYQSFYTMFRFARLLGLVELVREEPMIFPPPRGNLVRVDRVDSALGVVVSTRKVFRLTSIGEVDERCWSDLTSAWKEGWAPGEPAPYVPPPVAPPPRPKPIERPVVPPKEFTPYKWVETPSIARFRSLLKHLYNLQALGIDFPGVVEEIRRLSTLIGDWALDAEDSRGEAAAIGAMEQVRKYESWIKLINELGEALDDRDIDEAILILEVLVE